MVLTTTLSSSPPAPPDVHHSSPLPKLHVISEPGLAGRQQILQESSCLLPSGLAQAHEAVESRLKQGERRSHTAKCWAVPLLSPGQAFQGPATQTLRTLALSSVACSLTGKGVTSPEGTQPLTDLHTTGPAWELLCQLPVQLGPACS